ncbi:helix-turn-helix domain-containing protein [Odoribacter splanchnicus]|uniref:helix-turn-helix domain-containing protein n=1 Tax=Odoribacter splanchnicus TaxID=28118 RepID=UPI000E4CC3EF|nr:helix-turn-helix domain-containing protein [Odoribacter splanchnicus]RHA38648.1 DNA-binding protein [Odoribacter splanchnicus]
MEVVIIEKKAFEALLTDMATLLEKVDVLARKCSGRRLSNWLDGEDVCRMLRISPRTLQTLRDNRLIACSQINRKFFYRPEEVERLLPLMDCYRTRHDQPIKSDER